MMLKTAPFAAPPALTTLMYEWPAKGVTSTHDPDVAVPTVAVCGADIPESTGYLTWA
jgi:hypothetical protein